MNIHEGKSKRMILSSHWLAYFVFQLKWNPDDFDKLSAGRLVDLQPRN